MNTDLKTTLSGKTASFVLAGLLAIALGTIPATSFADGPPDFVFNEKCVPYEATEDFMLANGVDPTKILSSFGDPFGGGFPNAPWSGDFDENDDPVPCDEFHTHKRRTRYEACHFYDGSPCYFTTNGQLDQNAFTADEAGRIAFDIAEHFVIYEIAQNTEQVSPFPLPFGTWEPPAFFADSFCCGFAVGTQTKILNARGTQFTDNPLGLWKIGFTSFQQKAFDCGPPALPDPETQTPECVYLNELRVLNGLNSQAALFGMPLVVRGDEIFDLVGHGLASLRYRLGANGVPATAESTRYIFCPVHQDPTGGNIQPYSPSAFPNPDRASIAGTHVEFQVPCNMTVTEDPADDDGHLRLCLPGDPPFPGGPPSPAFPFGPTPPPTEQCLYDHFDCLQRTGDWCPGLPCFPVEEG
jgi:hypothetical protein